MLHVLHIKEEDLGTLARRCFLHFLFPFSISHLYLYSSLLATPSSTAILQMTLSAAMHSQKSAGISVDRMPRMQTSVYPKLGWPTGREPMTISPYVFLHSTFLHSMDITKPTQTSLTKKSIHAWQPCTIDNLCVWYLALPRDTKNPFKAAELKAVQTMTPQKESTSAPYLMASCSAQPVLNRHLHDFFCTCWEEEFVPQDIRDASIITL